MKLHLIGICGTGMGALAGLLKAAGHDVRGSDHHVYPPMSTLLASQQIPVFDGFRKENLDWGPDEVVVGNVCTKDHIEVVAATERKLKLTSFPAVLEDLYLTKRHSLVVAGTHGKTTTASLAAAVLLDAGRDPGFLIGGVPQGSQGFDTGFRLGGEKAPFVVEGDEYDTAFFDKGSKFFHYQPKTAILTSVELDHVDIFDSLESYKAAFKKFVALIPKDGLLVVAADDAGAIDCASAARCRVERYRVLQSGANHAASANTSGQAPAEWTARTTGTRSGGRTSFTVEKNGQPFGEFETALPGAHNLANALAVIAATHNVGLSAAEIARGMRRFLGVKRRQEVKGIAQGVTVIDDFAHHPTAVRETLAALRGRYGSGKLFALFEPRSATSRRAVFQADYATAFNSVDEVIIGAVHLPEKAPAGDRFDAERLAADLRGQGVPARHIADVGKIVEHVASRAAPGDAVVVMSSGDFEGIHEKLLDRLGLAITEARAADLPAVKALLDRVALPYPDLDAHLGDLQLLRDGGAVIGTVAVELYDEAALLRSLAVVPERRGEGLGWMLADTAITRARRRGARHVYLLTEKARDFFAEKFGFRPCERASLDEAVLASSQFRAAHASGWTTMKLDL